MSTDDTRGTVAPVREFARFDALPDVAKNVLAEGPLPDPFCRVCLALREAEDWLNGDEAAKRVEQEEGFVDVWLAANSAIISVRHWHDPAGMDGRSYWKPLGRAVERLGWKLVPGKVSSGQDARDAFFVADGDAHRFMNTVAGDLSWPRCLLLYVLAGWRP